MISALLLVLSVVGTPDALALPTDVSGLARGANAIGIDPAAAGQIDGVELQLRQQAGLGDVATNNLLDLRGAMPFGALTLSGGYTWDGGEGRRSNIGLSLGLARALRVGVTYRHVRDADLSRIAWDFGILAEPARWLTLTMGIDAWNQVSDPLTPKLLRVGGAIKPWRGEPWLTLATDMRSMRSHGDWDWFDTRAVLDISPYRGLHGLVSYVSRPGGHDWLFGLALNIWHVEMQGANRQQTVGTNTVSRPAWAVTWRARNASVLPMWPRTVTVVLQGGLQDSSYGLFSNRRAIPTSVLYLNQLAQRSDVETVKLEVGRLTVGMATVDELRLAISQLRQAGKTVTATLHNGDEKSYMVAAAAETVRMDPSIEIVLKGFAITDFFVAPALKKVGIRFDAVRVGNYKTAPDALTRDAARPEAIEVQTELLAASANTLRETLGVQRKLDDQQIKSVLQQVVFTAKEALSQRLVDEVVDHLADSVIPSRDSRADVWNPHRLHSVQTWGPLPVISVVPIVGTIVMSGVDNPLPGVSVEAPRVVRALEEARDNPHVAGVVLRVDSPGGDVYASELIWRAVARLAQRKPVAVSMADVAASGGYYVSAPAHRIFASANTVTGSIGIFALKPDVKEFLSRLGVHAQTVKNGEHADWDSITHPLSDDDRARLQRALNRSYDEFVDHVATGRHLSTDRVRAIAEGRVYSGKKALEVGLVDALGSLTDAVDWVAGKAGIAVTSPVHIDVPNRPSALPALVARFSQTSAMASWPEIANNLLRQVAAIQSQPLALLPWNYEMNP